MSNEPFDSDKAAIATSKLWLSLGELIAAAIPGAVEDGDMVKAVHWATCAEACYWKATGEADTHDVKDVLAQSQVTPTERLP